MISDGRFKFFKCHLRHIKSIVPRLRRQQKSCYRSLKICGFIFLCGFCSELREHKTRQERSTSVNKNGFNFKHSRKIYKNYARARAKKYVLFCEKFLPAVILNCWMKLYFFTSLLLLACRNWISSLVMLGRITLRSVSDYIHSFCCLFVVYFLGNLAIFHGGRIKLGKWPLGNEWMLSGTLKKYRSYFMLCHLIESH